MSFNSQGWNSISRSTTAPKPVFYSYDVNNIVNSVDNQDTLATITASGFFNTQADIIATNDLVYIVASDSRELCRLINTSGVITVVPLVSTPSIADGSLTPAKLNTAANYKVMCVPVSFASGAQATHTIYFPMAVTVTKIRSFVTAAIAGTDNATITAENNAGTGLTGGVVTIPASSAVATENNATPTANNTFTAGQKLQLVCAKTTAGGTVNVYIEYYTTG